MESHDVRSKVGVVARCGGKTEYQEKLQRERMEQWPALLCVLCFVPINERYLRTV